MIHEKDKRTSLKALLDNILTIGIIFLPLDFF